MVDWSFQDDCLDVIGQNQVGKIILPTGAGKSRIEFRHAKRLMVRDDGVHQVVIITAPRIILCQQLIKNFYEFLEDKYHNVSEVFTFVSSGKIPPIRVNGKLISSADIGKSTTCVDEVAYDIQLAKENDRDSIVFSTYASFDRCVSGIKKGIMCGSSASEVFLIADEAHYFTRNHDDPESINAFNTLNDNLFLFKSRFFFTATPKVSAAHDDADFNCGSKMDNTRVYGENIFVKQPKELIAVGAICEPRLHKMNMPADVTEENFDSKAGDIIFSTFKVHEQIINEDCGAEGVKLGGKLLVAVDGSKQLFSLIHNGFVQKARNRGINVAWTMSTGDVGTYFNENEYCPEEFLLKIRDACFRADGSVKNSTRLIVLHYDRLTEGIDVPSMSGLMILRGMNKVKKVQNIGRVLRSHPEDHPKDVMDKSKWIKPYAYIIVPNFEGISRFDELIVQLRNEYDAEVEVETPDIAIGLGEAEIEMQNLTHEPVPFKYISGQIQHNIEEFDRYKEKIWRQIESGGEIDLV